MSAPDDGGFRYRRRRRRDGIVPPPTPGRPPPGEHVRILAIGDVGVLDDMIHIGDEAMFDELVTQLRARGVDTVTAVSSNPAETTARYGVDAVRARRLPPRRRRRPRGTDRAHAPGPGGGRRRSAQLPARRPGVATSSRPSATPTPSRSPAAATWRRSGRCTSSSARRSALWPSCSANRSSSAARRSAPCSTGDDRDRVRTLLVVGPLVGLRESASAELVRSLGVDPRPPHPDHRRRELPRGSGREPRDGTRHGVRTAPSAWRRTWAMPTATPCVTPLARLLDRVVDETGLEIVFLAHFAALDPADERGDSLMHRRVREAMRSDRVRVEPTTDTPAAARVRARRVLVVVQPLPPGCLRRLGRGAHGRCRGRRLHDGQADRGARQLRAVEGRVGRRRARRDGDAAGPRRLARPRRHPRRVGESHRRLRAASAQWWDRVADALHGRA